MREAFDKIDYFLPRPVINFFLKVNLTPNQITVGRFLFLVLPAVALFTQGRYWFNILGLILIYFNSLLDLVDGEVAKKKQMITEVGPWLDTLFDYISLLLVLGALSIGVYSNNPEGFSFVLGITLLSLYGISLILNIDLQRIFNLGPRNAGDFVKEFYRHKNKRLTDQVLGSILFPYKPLFLIFFSTRYFLIAGILLGLVRFSLVFIALAYLFRLTVVFSLIGYILILENKRGRSGLIIVKMLRKVKREVENGLQGSRSF